MTHTAQLLAFLEDIGPEGQCDDCLSASLLCTRNGKARFIANPLRDDTPVALVHTNTPQYTEMSVRVVAHVA